MQRHLKVKHLLHSEDVARHSASFCSSRQFGSHLHIYYQCFQIYWLHWGESVNQVIQVFVFVLVGNKLQVDMNIFFVWSNPWLHEVSGLHWQNKSRTLSGDQDDILNIITPMRKLAAPVFLNFFSGATSIHTWQLSSECINDPEQSFLVFSLSLPISF